MDAFSTYLHEINRNLAALDITLEDIESFVMFGGRHVPTTEADIDRSARECVEGASAATRAIRSRLSHEGYTMKFDITNRWTGSVIFTAEIECGEDTPLNIKLGLAVKAAVKAGAYLADANLAGAKWRDGIVITKPPIQVFGLYYRVTILDAHMQIGC